MNKLLLKDTTDSDGTKNETEPQQQGCTNHHEGRKTRSTRISFEVHPSLLLEDMFEDLYGDDEDSDGTDADVLRLLQNTMDKQ